MAQADDKRRIDPGYGAGYQGSRTRGMAGTAPRSFVGRFLGWLSGTPTPTYEPPQRVNRYRIRKRSLPNTITAEDRRRAMEYWHGCCAICGRPPGLWHTVVLDHWVPLSHPDCPGTLRTNMIPMCHGNDGCNNHKHAKAPDRWLRENFSKRRADRKLEEIQYFFRWMEDPATEQAACPYCGKPVYYSQKDETWECNYCQSTGFFAVQYDEP